MVLNLFVAVFSWYVETSVWTSASAAWSRVLQPAPAALPRFPVQGSHVQVALLLLRLRRGGLEDERGSGVGSRPSVGMQVGQPWLELLGRPHSHQEHPDKASRSPGAACPKCSWWLGDSTTARGVASSCPGPPRGLVVKPRCRAVTARCSQAELGHVSWKLKSACSALS